MHILLPLQLILQQRFRNWNERNPKNFFPFYASGLKVCSILTSVDWIRICYIGLVKDLKKSLWFLFLTTKSLLAISKCIDHSEERCRQQEWLVLNTLGAVLWMFYQMYCSWASSWMAMVRSNMTLDPFFICLEVESQYIHLGLPYSRCHWIKGFHCVPTLPQLQPEALYFNYTVIVQIIREQTVLIDTLYKFRVLPKAFARVPLLEGRALWVELLSSSCRGRNHHLFISR